MNKLKDLIAQIRLAWHNATHIERMFESRDHEIKRLKQRCASLETIIREATTIDIDIPASHREPCSIIMCGRIGRREIVQTFSLHTMDFEAMMRQIQNMKAHGQVRYVDAPPNIRGFAEWEVRR